jgi:hypothetical protein
MATAAAPDDSTVTVRYEREKEMALLPADGRI